MQKLSWQSHAVRLLGCGAIILPAGLIAAGAMAHNRDEARSARAAAAESTPQARRSPVAMRTYIVSDFDRIRVEAPIAVAVAARRGTAARGEGPSDMLERIALDVHDRVLTVRLKPSVFGSGRTDGAMPRLFLSVPALRSVELAGAGTVLVDGLRGERTEVVASGSGSMRITDIDSSNIAVTQTGSGEVRLSGKARNAAMRVSGSGELNASGLTVADLDLTAEGSGSAQALATRAATLVAIGSANVDIDGHPACTVRHVGSGTVVCGGMDF